jgi:adenylate kinase
MFTFPVNTPPVKPTEGSVRYQTFLIFGAPGSGKGTQGVVLGRIPRFIHCACGDVFRALDTRTPLGQQFVHHSSRGELVPDELTVALWKANIDSRVETHQFKPDIDFLVLDGIPRNVEQARIMDRYIDVLHVFHLSCPDRQELHRRLRKRALKDNRWDDAKDETIERRIKTYEEESKPMLEYYSPAKVLDIDATQHPAVVFHTILSKIIKLPAFVEASRSVH